MTERIVVVGASAVTCLGLDLEATWSGLIAGRSGLRRRESLPRDRFLQDIAGLVDGLGPDGPDADPAVSRLPARFIHLALRAARDAWADAGLGSHVETAPVGLDPNRVAWAVGSAFGGLDFLEAERDAGARRKGLATSPYLVPGLIINQAGGQIAQHLGLRGAGLAPSNACASGGYAIAQGAMLLRAGMAELAVCGASESAFVPAVVNGFATMKALFPGKPGDRAEVDPALASRPFSRDRAGFVAAEGAAILILASERAADRLGLTPKVILAGWSMNSDGHHMAMPEPTQVARCLQMALNHAGVGPESVDYYNAHGTSTIVNDRVETAALKAVFGDRARDLPISSIKGAIGHALGAASAIEAAVCVKAVSEGMIPPTLNHLVDPELDLDYVPDLARPAPIRSALSGSLGFGGTNNALLFRRMSDV